MVAVDQFDPETLWFGIDHEPITRGEAIEGVAARLLIEVRAGDIDRRIATVEGLRINSPTICSRKLASSTKWRERNRRSA